MADKKDAGKKRPSTGSIQLLDPVFTAWLERMFRGGESAQSIDVYPLLKRKDREVRLYHYDVKASEKIGAERAGELSNEIYSECQLNCDATTRRGDKVYEVSVIDDRRGGLMKPVGTHFLTMEPRAHRPAPQDGETEDGEPEDEALTARKIMLESVKLVHDKDRFQQENEGKIVGDVMIVLKETAVDREKFIKDLLIEIKESNKETRESNKELVNLFKTISAQRVEERAVGIDEKNAEEDRADRRAKREGDNMWVDVTRAGMLEGVKILGGIFPGIGQAFLAHMTGKPIPDPPQLTDGATGPKPVADAPTQPQLPAVPEEKTIIDRFIDAAEKHRIDATHTAAEKLFGKDDDTGKALEPGVFTREQVAILSGVHAGTLGVEALDALLPDSGKPEAIAGMKMVQAITYLTPDMLKDVTKFMTLRKDARKK